ncbi:MAG: hypothetical protein JSV03_09505 [Planctomycetota bacterium]|nr:MAG: hypothetical protein JSV03_09505 [Planctomycetota bacterium]
MKLKTGIQVVGLAFILVLAPTVESWAVNCGGTSTGMIPIDDLGTGLYLGQFQGGLYPNGLNTLPAAHETEGLLRAQNIQPLDTNGDPNPGGKYVLLSIGMSNTTQEFCSYTSAEPCDPWTFMGQAAVDPNVNHDTLVIVNGARGGQEASVWESPTASNYDRIRDNRLAPKGLTEAQVQIVWVKNANAAPSVSLPNANADAYDLIGRLANCARALKVRYPNVQIVFFSNRIYAGYADTGLNPEPYAYESGFSCKWLIEAQIDQMAGQPVDPIAGDLNYNTVAPWIAWGPNLWADGINPRSDGLTWVCSDFQSDGTHPAQSGEEKVGTMLLDFMLNSPFASPWFLATPISPIIAEVTPDPDSVFAGSEYIEQLVLEQGLPSPIWSVIQTPTGAQVDGNGRVSGWTPAAANIGSSFTFEIQATNSEGSDTEQWEVVVQSIADLDGDFDVDQEDFGLFQSCYSGSGEPHGPGCEGANLDTDDDVDSNDFDIFYNCMSGPNQVPDC